MDEAESGRLKRSVSIKARVLMGEENTTMWSLFRKRSKSSSGDVSKTKVERDKAVTPNVEELIRLVESNSTEKSERRKAAEALGRTRDPRAVDLFIRILKDNLTAQASFSYNTPVIWAAAALGQSGDPRALEPLIDLGLANAGVAVGQATSEALETLLHSAKISAETLLEAHLRARALAKSRPGITIGSAAVAVNLKDAIVRKGDEAVEGLVAAYRATDESDHDRFEIRYILERIGSDRAKRALGQITEK
jgi:HEAT repeat protein